MIHGDLHNFAGPLAAGMIYGYMTYVLDSVWPAVFAHLLNNGLALFLSGAAKTYSALGLWPYILLIAVFCFCMFLALAMRTLENQMEIIVVDNGSSSEISKPRRGADRYPCVSGHMAAGDPVCAARAVLMGGNYGIQKK